jgi:hypothetical protein
MWRQGHAAPVVAHQPPWRRAGWEGAEERAGLEPAAEETGGASSGASTEEPRRGQQSRRGGAEERAAEQVE